MPRLRGCFRLAFDRFSLEVMFSFEPLCMFCMTRRKKNRGAFETNHAAFRYLFTLSQTCVVSNEGRSLGKRTFDTCYPSLSTQVSESTP